jgi:tRNA (mo5U34)-methyltransferase
MRRGGGAVTLEAPITEDREIAALGPWFHNLHLPDGRQTAPGHPLGDFPAFKWREIESSLPPDLSGWSALDIGCNAGFYSFELARRGARVLGIDHDERYLAQAAWARSLYGLDDQVELRCMTVYDLARQEQQFDLVLFMGVLYHLRYPLLGLDIVSAATRRLLVFQTLTTVETASGPLPGDVPIAERERLLERDWPAMAFVEDRFAGDQTNWWIPNSACVEALARSAGLEIVDRPGHEIYLCSPAGSAGRIAAEHVREALGD